MDQVITINKEGGLEGLQRKDGFDLRQMGEADIHRASEVLWSKEHQKWYVELRNVSLYKYITDIVLVLASSNAEQVQGVVLRIKENGELEALPDEICYFTEYEEAVKAEIMVLDFLRLRGLL